LPERETKDPTFFGQVQTSNFAVLLKDGLCFVGFHEGRDSAHVNDSATLEFVSIQLRLALKTSDALFIRLRHFSLDWELKSMQISLKDSFFLVNICLIPYQYFFFPQVVFRWCRE
jgi:hypothetical protein